MNFEMESSTLLLQVRQNKVKLTGAAFCIEYLQKGSRWNRQVSSAVTMLLKKIWGRRSNKADKAEILPNDRKAQSFSVCHVNCLEESEQIDVGFELYPICFVWFSFQVRGIS